MILAHVVGRITSTIQHPIVEGRKLLICDRRDAQGQPAGGYLIAFDAIGAGAGETVLILDEGTGARQILGEDAAPVRSLVVAIVDELNVPNQGSPR
jgi:ethanolamine utilization protein EutN